MSGASLPAHLAEVRDRWLQASREDRDGIYAREFLPAFAGLFASRPLAGAPDGFVRPRALVSLVGMSWQPVVLMASWVKPARLLLIVTRESRAQRPGGQDLVSYLAEHAGIGAGFIDVREVPDDGEVEIYRRIREFVAGSGIPARATAVDPTGGKKSMSVAAGLAAGHLGCPIVYVDYREYDAARRLPLPGTEYPRLLSDPLAELGETEFRALRAAFDRGDFGVARTLAERLAQRLYEPREAEALRDLAQGYGAWDRFDFGEALVMLRRADATVAKHASAGGWAWAPGLRRRLDDHVRLLTELKQAAANPKAEGQGWPLVANHVGAARRALSGDHATKALHLTYASLERFVDLVLWCDFELDDNCQDDFAGRLPPTFELGAYHALGRTMHGAAYEERALRGPLMFANGVVLAASLAPDLIERGELPALKQLSDARNRTEFEHGLVAQPPDLDKCRKWLALVERIVKRRPELGTLDPQRYLFPRLTEG